MASAQLQLIETEHAWKLDRRTVEIGKAGIAQARAALAKATQVSEDAADQHELFADLTTKTAA